MSKKRPTRSRVRRHGLFSDAYEPADVQKRQKDHASEDAAICGAIGAMVPAQFALWPMWKKVPRTWAADVLKLAAYAGILLAVGIVSYRGALPRTRAILTDEVAAGF